MNPGRIFTFVEIKRKILRVDSYVTKNNNNVIRLLVKLYTPFFEYNKNNDVVETQDSVLWGYIWLKEDLYKDYNIKKGDYIVVYGKLRFGIYNGRFFGNITAEYIKELEPANILEDVELNESVEEIPF